MQARIAPSIGELEGTHDQVWGTTEYVSTEEPTVFFGLYGLPDFYTLWRHTGKKYILWAGSDITHFMNGYWLEDGGTIRVDPQPLADWIEKHCESWVENEVERVALEDMGITAKVGPSFMGDVNAYQPCFKPNPRPEVYLSVSGNNFEMYGWNIVEMIADKCDVDFHLYGNTEPWESVHSNVFVHGRIPKEDMNSEIMHMQSGLRLCVEMDGFSEITAKSVLWGQYPIVPASYKYPLLTSFRDLENLIFQLNYLKHRTEANSAHKIYREQLNTYPWTKK